MVSSHREATREVDTEEAAVVDTREVVKIISIMARAQAIMPDTKVAAAVDSITLERIPSASMLTSTRHPSADTSKPTVLAVWLITASLLTVKAN